MRGFRKQHAETKRQSPEHSSSFPRPQQLTNFSPCNELDVVLLKKLPESITRNKLEVALTPFGAPVGVSKCHTSHLFVVIRQVHDHFGDPGLQVLYRIGVVLWPTFRRNAWLNAYYAIYYNIVWREERWKKRG